MFEIEMLHVFFHISYMCRSDKVYLGVMALWDTIKLIILFALSLSVYVSFLSVLY